MKRMLGAVILSCLAFFDLGAVEPFKEAGEWLVYEDAWLRFEYPKGWKMSAEEGRPREQYELEWSLEAQDGGFRGKGNIRIYGYSAGKEKDSLEKLSQLENWTGWKAVEKPKRFKLPGAECLRQRREGTGAETFVGPRIETISKVTCYDRNNNFYEIRSPHSLYNESGKPDERYFRNRKIFDRVISSLEFKAAEGAPPLSRGAGKKK